MCRTFLSFVFPSVTSFSFFSSLCVLVVAFPVYLFLYYCSMTGGICLENGVCNKSKYTKITTEVEQQCRIMKAIELKTVQNFQLWEVIGPLFVN